MNKPLFVLAMLAASIVSAQVMADKGQMLVYQETGGGEPGAVSRILVTPTHLRMDYGQDQDDFVLLDRKASAIYNVVHDSERVLYIPERSVNVESPIPLDNQETSKLDPNAPTILGNQVVRWTYTTNKRTCLNVMSAEGLLPDAVEALKQFYRVLAGQQALTINATPADMQDACDLSQHTFAPERHLKHGLPVMQWQHNGRQKQLVDLKEEMEIDAGLMKVPEGYLSYTVGE